MEILVKPCGEFYTNCYIIDKKIIIDPGVGAFEFVKEHVENPVAIINTHGHFDHMWDDKKIKDHFNIPVYIHKEDAFMLESDPFGYNPPKVSPDVLLEEGIYNIGGYEVQIRHFPGHTPGSITIEIGDEMFSGDFIFDGSIGRVDFPYSDAKKMKQSIEKFLKINYDKRILPGHGPTTTINKAKSFLPMWLDYL
ncbi:MBL fold metallo-hydrolase [Nautilia sp. PV-1]|uniref:MBL fold metallo-hydrolase n=1 Tax=Nautilia sp. PV-1 TaxID=2579250 RepID=UPI000FD819F7|nr:MBL fold metallo-hydrolase [Nautilia sp. PV-1]AZV47208.1 MBL fold metallo-hydrolase [Nautilia sp. PV-1]